MIKKEAGTGSIFTKISIHHPRYQFIINFLTKSSAFSSVLDVGCRDGQLLEYLRREFGRKIYGVDVSQEGVQLARNRKTHAAQSL